jgi:hypothetical protein
MIRTGNGKAGARSKEHEARSTKQGARIVATGRDVQLFKKSPAAGKIDCSLWFNSYPQTSLDDARQRLAA